MSISGSELALSAVAALGMYLMYREGEKLLGGKTPSDDPGIENQGINPNWKPGAKIKAPNSINYHTSTFPNCQIWNDQSQLFEDTGDSEADGSKNACFVKYQNYLARYVDENKQISFNVENPLVDTNAKDHGLCLFFQDGVWSSHPGPAPVNMDQRLCFAASEQLEGQGMIFWDTGGSNTFNWNPNLSYGAAPFAMTNVASGLDSNGNITVAAVPANGWFNNKSYQSPPAGGHCEEWVNWELYGFWSHTPNSASSDGSVQQCVNSGNPNMRWNDGQNLVYWDSTAKKMVETPIAN